MGVEFEAVYAVVIIISHKKLRFYGRDQN